MAFIDKEKQKSFGPFSIAYIPFVVLISLWCLLSYGGIVKSLFLPTPTVVISELVKLFSEQRFLSDILVSLSRIFAGFILSAVFAIPLGILMGTFKTTDVLFSPIVGFVRYMPASAFIPLVILWFGIGFWEKVIVIFISIFFYLVILVADAAANVRQELKETALTLGATKSQILLKVIVPASLPDIWNALRIMLGVGWTMIIIVELVAAQSGIGAMIIHAQRFLQTPKVIAGIIVIGALGIMCDLAFRWLRPVLFRWIK